ncbi:MAG: hypothetical protein R2910_01130 [Gemmatimonadales bacterium]
MRNTSRLLTGALLAATVGLGACSDSSGPSTTPLSAANAADVGDAVASTAGLALAGVSPSVPNFGTGFPLFANGRAISGGIAFSPPADSLPNCPAASDLTDTDGDGVPDNAVWTFNAADCTETDLDGNRSVVTGSVAISDPGLTVGYDLQLNSLTGQFYQSGDLSPFLQLIMDGDWSLRATSDAINADQNYTYVLSVQNERVTLANDLSVAFNAANGSSISWGVPLPNGTISIDGAWRVSSSRESHSLTLVTVTPLSYDDTCYGVVSGVLDAYGTGGAVRVTWTACDTYTAVFMPNAQ